MNQPSETTRFLASYLIGHLQLKDVSIHDLALLIQDFYDSMP